jgi:large-conductance mechanosensitive channel
MDTLTIIIVGGILLVCIVIAFMAANRNTWRMLKSSPAVEDSESESSTAVDHYTEMRDELTLEDAGVEDEDEEEEVEEKSSGGGFGLISNIIGLIIGAVVFSTLWSTIKPVLQTMNVSDSGMNPYTFNMTQQLINWFPIVMIIGFVLIILTTFGMHLGGSSNTTTKKVRKRGVKHYTSMRDKLSEK